VQPQDAANNVCGTTLDAHVSEPPIDRVVMVYEAFVELGESAADVQSIRALAEQTRSSPVAFFVQGSNPDDPKKVARYVIHGGHVEDESAKIQGGRIVEYMFDADQSGALLLLGRSVPETGPDVHMCAAQTLEDFLLAGMRRFPSATEITCAVCMHGGDDGSISTRERPSQLTLRDWTDLFRKAESSEAKKLSLLILHSCLLGQFAVLCHASSLASYVVASAAPKVKEDLKWGRILAELLQNPTMTTEALGRKVIELEHGPVTDALFNMEGMDALKSEMDGLGDALSRALDDPPQRDAIFQAMVHTVEFSGLYDDEYPNARPLRPFLENLAKHFETFPDSPVPDLCHSSLQALDELTIYKKLYRHYDELGSLSFFFPVRINKLEFQNDEAFKMYGQQGGARDLLRFVREIAEKENQEDLCDWVGRLRHYKFPYDPRDHAVAREFGGVAEALREIVAQVEEALHEASRVWPPVAPYLRSPLELGKILPRDWKSLRERIAGAIQSLDKEDFQDRPAYKAFCKRVWADPEYQALAKAMPDFQDNLDRKLSREAAQREDSKQRIESQEEIPRGWRSFLLKAVDAQETIGLEVYVSGAPSPDGAAKKKEAQNPAGIGQEVGCGWFGRRE